MQNNTNVLLPLPRQLQRRVGLQQGHRCFRVAPPNPSHLQENASPAARGCCSAWWMLCYAEGVQSDAHVTPFSSDESSRTSLAQHLPREWSECISCSYCMCTVQSKVRRSLEAD